MANKMKMKIERQCKVSEIKKDGESENDAGNERKKDAKTINGFHNETLSAVCDFNVASNLISSFYLVFSCFMFSRFSFKLQLNK